MKYEGKIDSRVIRMCRFELKRIPPPRLGKASLRRFNRVRDDLVVPGPQLMSLEKENAMADGCTVKRLAANN